MTDQSTLTAERLTVLRRHLRWCEITGVSPDICRETFAALLAAAERDALRCRLEHPAPLFDRHDLEDPGHDLEELEQRVDTLEADLQLMTAREHQAKAERDEARGQAAELAGQVDQLRAENRRLQASVGALCAEVVDEPDDPSVRCVPRLPDNGRG